MSVHDEKKFAKHRSEAVDAVARRLKSVPSVQAIRLR